MLKGILHPKFTNVVIIHFSLLMTVSLDDRILMLMLYEFSNFPNKYLDFLRVRECLKLDKCRKIKMQY